MAIHSIVRYKCVESSVANCSPAMWKTRKGHRLVKPFSNRWNRPLHSSGWIASSMQVPNRQCQVTRGEYS